MFPSSKYRQCTSDLKRGPIDKFIRGLPQAVVINCLVIRAEESSPRSKLTPWKVDEQLMTRHRTVYSWLPIFNLSLAEVLAWHRTQRIPLHPVYVPEYHWMERLVATSAGYLAVSASFQVTLTWLRSTSMAVKPLTRSAN
jgi:3'-phosphoadenosine 5'-phosphosulfate sulfotransferase (PAPS reductase)/FAD synthetase